MHGRYRRLHSSFAQKSTEPSGLAENGLLRPTPKSGEPTGSGGSNPLPYHEGQFVKGCPFLLVTGTDGSSGVFWALTLEDFFDLQMNQQLSRCFLHLGCDLAPPLFAAEANFPDAL